MSGVLNADKSRMKVLLLIVGFLSLLFLAINNRNTQQSGNGFGLARKFSNILGGEFQLLYDLFSYHRCLQVPQNKTLHRSIILQDWWYIILCKVLPGWGGKSPSSNFFGRQRLLSNVSFFSLYHLASFLAYCLCMRVVVPIHTRSSFQLLKFRSRNAGSYQNKSDEVEQTVPVKVEYVPPWIPRQSVGSQASKDEIQQLLSQASRELEPWKNGVSLEMVERLYCIDDAEDSMRIQVQAFQTLKIKLASQAHSLETTILFEVACKQDYSFMWMVWKSLHLNAIAFSLKGPCVYQCFVNQTLCTALKATN